MPNGQIADSSTALVETLEAVKEEYENAKYAGIACGIKNSGLGVGVPDYGRCKASVEQGKIHVRTAAACIGQGLLTVMLQIAVETLKLPPSMIVMETPDTERTPNSGTTTASRQTLVTGEAVRRVTQLVRDELDKGRTIEELEGEEFYAEYLAKTDPIGTDVPHPISHVGYGYATQNVLRFVAFMLLAILFFALLTALIVRTVSGLHLLSMMAVPEDATALLRDRKSVV